jgi:5-methylcytosine-specific restriction endonuclease McrA
MSSDKKVCTKCKQALPVSEFWKHNKKSNDGYYFWCKACQKNAKRQKYATDEDHRNKRRKKNAEYKKAYSLAHPGYTAEENNKRRARRVNATGSFTRKEFMALCESQEWRCLCCGRSDVGLTADHIVPLSRGGTNDIGNIQGLCGFCNGRKFTEIIDYRAPFVALAT